MHWRELPSAMDFDSVKHRDFVIDALVKIGVFSAITDSLLGQKSEYTTLLKLPDPKYVRDIGRYISQHEEAFDKEFAHPTGAPIVQISQKSQSTTLELWFEFWIDHLDTLKRNIQAFVKAGVDFESVNRFVWEEVRKLIMRAAADAYRLRIERYRKGAGQSSKWFQRVVWWFRTRKLEWKHGKRKILYGNYERYDTDQAHDPAKFIMIFCGYCGGTIKDNTLRPGLSQKFEPVIFDVQKNGQKVLIAATASLSHYETKLHCANCHETFENAYVNKVARAVMIVLL